MQMKKLFSILLIILCATLTAAAQRITGRIIDTGTGEGAPFVNIVYEGTRVGTQTDDQGNFTINYRAGGTLVASCVGYEKTSYKVKRAGETIEMKLKPMDFSVGEAKVTAVKQKYSRKNNPAVELMRKVIEAKKNSDLKQHDFYTVEQYNKLNFALADVTPKVFEEGKFKRMPFLKEHVEVSPETGKLILPLTVEETVTQMMYRKSDDTEKNLVIGKRQEGINQLFNTGDILTQMLNDFFTEVNLYDDNIRLLQYQFISPLSSKDAISFYRYFITDTCFVEGEKCIELQFTPNNSQDFGFSGSLFVTADSTYRMKKVSIGVPVNTGINFVDLMQIEQVYDQLPSGEQVLLKDDMLLVMKFVKENYKVQAKRTTEYSKFDFAAIPDQNLRFKGKTKVMADAQMQEDSFWKDHRSEKLTTSEGKVNLFLQRIQNMKGFKPVIWVTKGFIENYIETSLDPKKGSKIDYGPVNTTISHNDVDGLRLRASLMSTANLSPHFFFKGYGAYGFADERWKYGGTMTYSFNKKKYLPREFPMRNLSFSYTYDVMSPSDIFLPTNKDNVFLSLKWSKVDHMMYNQNIYLSYDNEWENGLTMKWKIAHNRNEPTSSLFYQPVANGFHTPYNAELQKYEYDRGPDFNGGGRNIDYVDSYTARPWSARWDEGMFTGDPAHLNTRYLTTTDFTYFIEWQPGAEYLNTKNRRILVNKDAPLFSISHSFGIKGLWSDYTYNTTELHIYKRWWVKSWGKIDTRIKAGAQWNKVPFPLLLMPRANTSYIRESDLFSLVKNMEFLNDRYVSFVGQWDLNGKLLNRIPGMRRLKWREYFGVNALWGTLMDKNNPYLAQNQNSTDLFFFPSRYGVTGQYQQQSQIMNPRVPYVEAYVGIHNIFKLLWIQYVHRLTYINEPGSIYGDTQKWGIRFILKATF